MDLLVLPVDGLPVLLANKSESAGKWIAFQLHGTRSNRDAIGTKLTIQSCGHTQTETVRNGGSYISHNDPRIHFGLNICGEVEKVSIQWPSGRLQTLSHLKPGQYITVEEPR